MVGEGPSAFEHDVSRIECFVKESGDAALESHGCAEVTRAIPDEPAVVAIDGEASAYADVDSEQGRQAQSNSSDSITDEVVFLTARGRSEAEVAKNQRRQCRWCWRADGAGLAHPRKKRCVDVARVRRAKRVQVVLRCERLDGAEARLLETAREH